MNLLNVPFFFKPTSGQLPYLMCISFLCQELLLQACQNHNTIQIEVNKIGLPVWFTKIIYICEICKCIRDYMAKYQKLGRNFSKIVKLPKVLVFIHFIDPYDIT